MIIPPMVPAAPPSEHLQKYLGLVLESGVFSNFGPLAKELEKKIARLIGVEAGQVVYVSSATAGITAAALASGSSSWLAPSWTFTASISGLLQAGVGVTFGDSNPESHLLDRRSYMGADAELIALPFGSGLVEELMAGSKPKIFDAAASLGHFVGNPGTNLISKVRHHDAVVFSMHATKVFGAGEGGIVVAGSSDLANEIRMVCNFGLDDNRVSMRRGFNGKASEFSAAVSLAVLEDYELELSQWREARDVARNFQNQTNLNFYDPEPDFVSPYLIVEFSSSKTRKEFERVSLDAQIGTRRWWRACHKMEAYMSLPKTNIKTATTFDAVCLGLPFYRGISRSDLSRVFACFESLG